MYAGERLVASVDASVVVLGADARAGRLAICAGAGLSVAAGLPSGPELARRLDRRFRSVTGYACANPEDLLAVADAAASLPDGLAAVQRVVVDLAEFDTVPPTLAHHLLALLMAEGALRLLLTNWDDCVERSWRDFEQLRVAKNASEANSLTSPLILKIHGCCTEPTSLLITSAQLSAAPLWTSAYFQAELIRSSMVFIGIGDVADYARKRVAELAALVAAERVRVVSPTIKTAWVGSMWEALVPTLPEDRRLDRTADQFMDELAREWVMDLIHGLLGVTAEAPEPASQAVAESFTQLTASQALEWLRRATAGWSVGRSVVRDPMAAAALEAIGRLADRGAAGTDIATIGFLLSSSVIVGDDRFDILLCKDGRTANELEGIAVERARQVAKRIGPVENLRLLVAASLVRGPRPAELAAGDIIDPDVPVDQLIDGDRQIAIQLTYVDAVLAA